MVLKKYEIETALHVENQEISAGRLKEDNPLDVSDGFAQLCEACRRGDLKACQEMIQEGVNINARDRFDYTPLILVRSSFGSSISIGRVRHLPVFLSPRSRSTRFRSGDRRFGTNCSRFCV